MSNFERRLAHWDRELFDDEPARGLLNLAKEINKEMLCARRGLHVAKRYLKWHDMMTAPMAKVGDLHAIEILAVCSDADEPEWNTIQIIRWEPYKNCWYNGYTQVIPIKWRPIA